MIEVELEQSGRRIPEPLRAQSRPHQPRVRYGDASACVIRVYLVCTLHTTLVSCLPLIRAVQTKCESLPMPKGITLRQSGLGVRSHLRVALLGETEVELSLNRLVKSNVQTHVKGITQRRGVTRSCNCENTCMLLRFDKVSSSLAALKG